MSRYVIGVDPLLTGVHIARCDEEWKPDAKSDNHFMGQFAGMLVAAPSLPAHNFSVEANVRRMNKTVDKALAEILPGEGEELALVMMMKPLTGLPNKDTSGPRRMMLAGELMRRLVERGIPVGEVAPLTLAKWLTGGHRVFAPKGFSESEAAIREAWPHKDIHKAFPKYRLTTLAVAAAGAVAAGIETARVVDDTTMNVLKMMTLPEGWELPTTGDGWRNHFQGREFKPGKKAREQTDDEQTDDTEGAA